MSNFTKQLEKTFPNERILISNCRSNGGYVIQTSLYNWQPFDTKKDKIIY